MKEFIHRHGFDFSQVPFSVITSKSLSSHAVRIYAYLSFRQGGKSTSWAGLKKMSDDLGMSEGMVKRALSELHKADYIRRKRRKHSTSVTHLFSTPSLCKQFDSSQITSDPNRNSSQITSDPTYQITSDPTERYTENDSNTMGAKQPRPRDVLFDSICEVCRVDPATSGSTVGKIKSKLVKAAPPYTPDEVRAFGEWWWSDDFRRKRDTPPTLWQLAERIGIVRNGHKPPAQIEQPTKVYR